MDLSPPPLPSPEEQKILSGDLEVFPYENFSQGLPFAIVRCQPQRPREPHAHEFHEIVLVTHGSGVHISRYHAWPVQAGDIFVIGGTQGHYYDKVSDLCLVNLLFQPHLLKLDTFDIGKLPGFQAMFGMVGLPPRQEFRSRFRLKMKDLSPLLGTIDHLEHELQSNEPGHVYFAYNHFMAIIGILSRLHSEQGSFEASAVIRMANVISYMEMNPVEPHNMKTLAAIAGMTERSFLRVFRQATGNSPHSHLLDLRIKRAAEELRNTDRQITDIGFRAGFNDSNYFTRQFRQRMGVTPSQYRRNAFLGRTR